MPIEIIKKTGEIVYLCRICGDKFSDENQAEDHESYCSPICSMWDKKCV